MPASQNNKMKIIYLIRIMEENTDPEHGLSVNEIIKKLDEYDIRAERKSIYDDFDALRECGYDIVKKSIGKDVIYYLKEHIFSHAELKLLVDAIASSRFLTKKTSSTLVEKIEKLGSIYQAKTLKREVFIMDRPKTENDVMFANIDILSEAIVKKVRISFEYDDWNHKKQLVKRPNGDKKDVSPCFIELQDGNYYMVAYEEEKLKHFRVDKMLNIELEDMPVCESVYKTEYANPAAYSSRIIGMFSGKEEEIRLKVDESKIGVVIDRFGASAVNVIPIPENGIYTLRINVQVSKILYGWLFSVSDIVSLAGPEWVVKDYKEMLKNVYDSIN